MHIRNNAEHPPTMYYTTQAFTPPAALPTRDGSYNSN